MRNLAWWIASTPGRFALGTVIILGLFASVPSQARAQGQGKYLIEVSQRLGNLIARANKDGYILYDNQFSIGGGWLKQGEDKWVNLYTVTLKAGKSYRIMAAGDNDAKDVDLQITDVKGAKVFKSEEETAAEAVIDFTPKETQRYLVRVRLYASNQNLPCMCLAIVMAQK